MSQSQTEMVRLQRAKWAVLSTVVQAQTVIVGSALTAAITTGEPAAWVSFGVILIGSLMTVLSIVGGRNVAPVRWELGTLRFDGRRMCFEETLFGGAAP